MHTQLSKQPDHSKKADHSRIRSSLIINHLNKQYRGQHYLHGTIPLSTSKKITGKQSIDVRKLDQGGRKWERSVWSRNGIDNPEERKKETTNWSRNGIKDPEERKKETTNWSRNGINDPEKRKWETPVWSQSEQDTSQETDAEECNGMVINKDNAERILAQKDKNFVNGKDITEKCTVKDEQEIGSVKKTDSVGRDVRSDVIFTIGDNVLKWLKNKSKTDSGIILDKNRRDIKYKEETKGCELITEQKDSVSDGNILAKLNADNKHAKKNRKDFHKKIMSNNLIDLKLDRTPIGQSKTTTNVNIRTTDENSCYKMPSLSVNDAKRLTAKENKFQKGNVDINKKKEHMDYNKAIYSVAVSNKQYIICDSDNMNKYGLIGTKDLNEEMINLVEGQDGEQSDRDTDPTKQDESNKCDKNIINLNNHGAQKQVSNNVSKTFKEFPLTRRPFLHRNSTQLRINDAQCASETRKVNPFIRPDSSVSSGSSIGKYLEQANLRRKAKLATNSDMADESYNLISDPRELMKKSSHGRRALFANAVEQMNLKRQVEHFRKEYDEYLLAMDLSKRQVQKAKDRLQIKVDEIKPLAKKNRAHTANCITELSKFNTDKKQSGFHLTQRAITYTYIPIGQEKCG